MLNKTTIIKKNRNRIFNNWSWIGLLLLFSNSLLAQIDLNRRFPDSAITNPEAINGDFVLIGNSNLTLQFYNDFLNNSGQLMIYNDVDDEISTLNSSSAELVLPLENGADAECTEVEFAGLYWTGRAHNDGFSPNTFTVSKVLQDSLITKNYDKTRISLKGPLDTEYQDIQVSDQDIFYPETTNDGFFLGFADVTEIVRQQGVGSYTIADIALNEGLSDGTGLYGGWYMYVVYSNPDMNGRFVTVYDGYEEIAAFSSGEVSANDLTIRDLTVSSVEPINVKLGLVAGEGDVSISGDFFDIQDVNGNFRRLSHPLNSGGNFFNSSILTDSPSRDPDVLNNTGIDIAVFDLPNQASDLIAPSQNEVTFQYGTIQDRYTIFNLGFSVDAFRPEAIPILEILSIDGEVPVDNQNLVANPAEDIVYQAQIINPSSEALEDVELFFPMPFFANYVDGSIAITTNVAGINFDYEFQEGPIDEEITPNGCNGNINAAPYGRLVVNIDNLPLPPNDQRYEPLITIQFTVRTIEDCLLLKAPFCTSSLEVVPQSKAVGSTSGLCNIRSFIAGIDEDNCNEQILDPLRVELDPEEYVGAFCTDTPDQISISFCQENPLQFNEITEVFSLSEGIYRFYDAFPIDNANEITSTTGFPLQVGRNDFFAVPESLDGCFIPLDINVLPTPEADFSTNSLETCLNQQTSVEIIGSNGIAPYTFVLSDGQTLVSDDSGRVNLALDTSAVGSFNLSIVSVNDSNSADQVNGSCQNAYPDSTLNFTVYEKPTVSIQASSVEFCQSDNFQTISIQLLTGLAPLTLDYIDLNGINQQITTDNNGNASIAIDASNAGDFNFEFLSVQDSNECSSSIQEIIDIQINPLPLVDISLTNTVLCFENSAEIQIVQNTGTPPFTIDYLDLNGDPQQIVTDSLGSATIPIPDNLVGNFTYTFNTVSDQNSCSTSLSQSIDFQVLEEIIVTASDNTLLCQDVNSETIIFEASQGEAPYEFTIETPQGIQTFESDANNQVQFVQNSDVLGTFTYRVLSVTDSRLCRVDFSTNGLSVPEVIITVEPKPVLTPATLEGCDFNADNRIDFSLELIAQAVNFNPDVEVTIHRRFNDANDPSGIVDALPGSSFSANVPDVVWARGTNTNTSCFSVVPVQLTAQARVVQSLNPLEALCDDGNDGQEIFDLTQIFPQIDSQYLGQDYTFESFHLSLDDAERGESELPLNYPNISDPQTIFARVLTEDCYELLSFEISLTPDPQPVVEDVLECSDRPTLVDGGVFETYFWSGLTSPDDSQDNRQQTIAISNAGTYNLSVTNAQNCEADVDFSVNFLDPPIINNIVIDNNTATIIASGAAALQYRVNGGTWQDSNIFNLPLGVYTAEVRYLNLSQCISDSMDFAILAVPNFISPNGDGVNDKWVLEGLQIMPGTKIRLFDRYGKLILNKETVAGESEVWDANYLTRKVPSGTYWYIIEFPDGRVLRSWLSVRNFVE